MRVTVTVLAVLGLAAVIWVAHEFGMLSPFFVPTDAGGESPPASASGIDSDALDDQPRDVAALGRLEPAGGVIEVCAPLGTRLMSVTVEEGSPVKKDEILAYLDSRPLREIELKSAESQLKEAKARRTAEANLADARIVAAGLAVEEAQIGRGDVEAQQGKVKLLEERLTQSKTESDRLKGLSQEVVSQQEKERQALAVRQAEADLQTAKMLANKLARTTDLSLRAAESELKAAKASKEQVLSSIPVESLQNQRDLAEILWERTAISAPSKGAILKIFVRPGESIGSFPILQMGNLERMAVVAEVHETDVNRIVPRMPVLITSRVFKPPYNRKGLRGKVTQVGSMIAAPLLKRVDPFAQVDRHVVKVRIELDEEASKQVANLVNLQVDVRFLCNREADVP